MEKLKKEAIWKALGIAGIVGGTVAFVVLNILNAWAFILAAIACYPMAKYLWKFTVYMHRNPVRILRKALPKAGFAIEETEWNDEQTTFKINGKYQGDDFIIYAHNDDAYITIYDLAWFALKSSDPDVPQFMEAINYVNAHSPNMSVVMAEPDQNGLRPIYTITRTILPGYCYHSYLSRLLTDILERKADLNKAVNMERPFMNQRRGPVGFQPAEPVAENQEDVQVGAAAQSDTRVGD